MRSLFLLMMGMMSFILPVLGSEKNENKVVIFAKVNPQRPELRYVGKDSINACNQFNMKAAYNSPCFIDCCYRSEDSRTNIATFLGGCENRLDTLRIETSEGDTAAYEANLKKWQNEYNQHLKGGEIAQTFLTLTTMSFKPIPRQCFLDEKDPSTFKKVGDVLFSFVKKMDGTDINFIVKLESDLGGRNPKKDIEAFKTSQVLLCDLAHQTQLCNAQIIAIGKYGQHLHGPKGYIFEKEETLTKQETEFAQSVLQRQETQKQRASLYKKLFGGSIIAVIMMYILYQKIYTATS